jgi:hypothetical protein
MRHPDTLEVLDLTDATSLLFYMRRESWWSGSYWDAQDWADWVEGTPPTGILAIDGGTATSPDADAGEIQYAPAASDFDDGGVYEVQFRVVLEDGTKASWPLWPSPEARLVISGSGVNL